MKEERNHTGIWAQICVSPSDFW